MSMAARALAGGALLLAAVLAGAATPGGLRLEGTVTVSGVSSGGYMAQQFHVAHAATVDGAAIVAAGPYRCAGGGYPANLARALQVCMSGGPGWLFRGPPEAAARVAATREAAAAGTIDDPVHLAGDRVFLFSGARDTTVPTPVVAALRDYYRAFIDDEAAVRFVVHPRAGHAVPTLDYGNAACDVTGSPYLNDCDYDLAGTLLEHLLGPLRPPRPPRADGLHPFDQGPFAEPDAGLHARGHLYVPAPCAAGAACRLHVAFHGCRQHEEAVGDAFYAHAGYNRWAESNQLVVLYPQVRPDGTLWPNPEGCWDWWGYSGEGYATRDGAQVAAVRSMLDALRAGEPLP